MNWLAINAALNGVLCAAALVGLTYSLRVDNDLFTAALALAAAITGLGAMLRLAMLVRKRRIAQSA